MLSVFHPKVLKRIHSKTDLANMKEDRWQEEVVLSVRDVNRLVVVAARFQSNYQGLGKTEL